MTRSSLFFWLLDVEPLWQTKFDGRPPFRSTEIWANGPDAKKALSYLSEKERAKALEFLRHHDAKLSLGSSLMKRRAISRTCNIPWNQVTISEDMNRKPVHIAADPGGQELQFNVSHHGSLVALVGCADPDIKLGVDIAMLNWEKDYPKVMEEGFEAWADTYKMIFSDKEVRDIVAYDPPSHYSAPEDIRAKLRKFYAHWCLKEAYVKMTGEALMADWLRDLEFRKVRVPNADPRGKWGEVCNDMEIWFKGEQLDDMRLEVRAYREDYLIAMCASSWNVALERFKILDKEEEIYPN